MPIVSETIPVDVHVRSEQVESPLAEIFPFRFDRVFLPAEDPADTLGLWLNQQENLLKEGTYLDEWTSGHLDKVEFKRLKVGARDFQKTHTPVVTNGLVSFSWDLREVRGDTSALVVAREDYAVDDVLQEIELPEEVISSSLGARIFVRTDTNEVLTLFKWDLVNDFTGEYGEGSRTVTSDESGFLTEYISRRHREIVYEEPNAYISNWKGPWVTTGDEELTIELVSTYWEEAGAISGGRVIATKYFPIQADSVRVVVIDGTDLSEFTKVDTLDLIPGEDYTFEVDEALGLVKIGGYQAQSLILSEDIDDEADYIPFFFEEHYPDYPAKGILAIDDEAILYEEKTSKGFSSLTRGYMTTAASHTRGVAITENPRGEYKNGTLYVSYKSVPRLEYDVASSQRTTNKESNLDVKSSNVVASSGVLVLSSEVVSLSSIELTSTTKQIAANYYGPVYFGTDSSLLIAKCLDEQGKPVDGIDVTMEIVKGNGLLADSTEIIRTSNSDGEIYGLFTAPLTDTSGLYTIASFSYDGTDTYLGTREISPTLRHESFWVFQILKCDPIYGTVGIRSATLDVETDTTLSESSSAVIVDGAFWNDSIAYVDVLTSEGVKQRFTVTSNLKTKIGDVHYTKMEFAEAPESGSLLGTTCWLLGPEDVDWNGDAPDGLKRILYAWNEDAIHPITEASGAYSPVLPDTIRGNRFVFEGKELPEPSATDDTVNLGAYLIYGPEEVSIRAKAIDPLSGQTIYSNVVRLKILMSSALLGVEFTENLPIPYGFRLYTEAHNNSNSIGGVNFYTINPNANGIEQLPILGVL